MSFNGSRPTLAPVSEQVIPEGYEWYVRSASDIDRVWVLRDRDGADLELSGVSPRIERFVKGTSGPVQFGDGREAGVTPIYVKRSPKGPILAGVMAGVVAAGLIEIARMAVG